MREAETWIFDLDNTLYPAEINLFQQIDERMRGFIADLLGLDHADAHRIQKQYFREYGTSMRGLMERHGVDPFAFLDHVHEIDVSVLEPNPALDTILARLPGRKLIHTNASTRHAERVLHRLGIAHHFEAVFDIIAADFVPKPQPGPYRTLAERFAIATEEAVMVEDMARNLAPAAELGMTTVWIDGGSELGDAGRDGLSIDHVIGDLVAWLEDVAEGRV